MRDWGERIDWVLKTYADDNQTAMGKAIGLTQPAVANLTKGGVVPSGETLCAILENYPEVSPDWLLLGREPRVRVYSGADPLAPVRRTVIALRQIIRDLEYELSDDVTRNADLYEAVDILSRLGYDVRGMFGAKLEEIGYNDEG